MTGEEIYNLFKQELDGEEFEDEDDAIRMMNVADRKIRSERDWEILKTDATLPAGTTSLDGITDLDKVLKVWATKNVANDEIELKKANFNARHNYDGDTFDYYIDHKNNEIVFIHDDVWDGYDLIVDYKYKPDALDMEAEPVIPEDYQPRIAYEMVLAYKRGDESFDGYREVERKNEEMREQMVDWNEGLTLD